MELPFKTTKMLEEYFNYQLEMEKKYGKNTIVFMEVGSFFEIYEIDTDIHKIGKSKNMGTIFNMQVTRKSKNKEHGIGNPYMVGFPNYAIDKFINKLIDNKYTVVTVIQTDTNSDGSKQRKLGKIYSPGTYDEDITRTSNYLVSVYIEKYKDKTYAHLAAIDFGTGESKLYSTFNTFSQTNKVSNDIFRFIHSLNPKEILFNKIDDKTVLDISNEYQLHNCIVHICEVLPEYTKVSYQNQFLRKIFNSKNCEPIEYLELSSYQDLVVSFIFCLQFAYEHDNTIINKIKKPVIVLDDEHLVLNNDSIYQLNIINTSKTGKFSSLFNLVNQTSTNMGKRLLKNRLLYPITNVKILEKRYDNIDKMKLSNQQFSSILKNIIDIEKYHRKAYTKKLDPHDFHMLDNAYKYIKELLVIATPFVKITKTEKVFDVFYNEYNSIFDIEKMKDIKLNKIDTSFFKKGVFENIDTINDEIITLKNSLYQLAKKYSLCISKVDSTVKVLKNDIDGYYFSCTPSRVDVIKKKYPDVTVSKLKSVARITSDTITKTSDELCKLQKNIGEIIKTQYISFIYKLYTKNTNLLQRIVDIISEIDVICSSSKVAIKYSYNRPTIKKYEKESNKSYVNTTELRHPIIERIINTEYIVNDICIGTDGSGMLIYGVNSSGKSSIIRALGCNIVLAQAGMYVSAKSFEYYPYNLLLSKISCQDNLFKGQSTFISEMMEIRNMIQRSDKNTMVLADELCAGTEGLSATSLVSSTIIHLCKNDSTFLFSTHLHSLMEIEQITTLEKLTIKNFGVDIKDNIVSYNRKLKDGSGTSMYGLEIAKSLNIGSEFMKNAFNIRSVLEKKSNFILNTKTSKYNSNLYVDQCNICNKGEDAVGPLHTHHINHQKDTDKDGIINNKHFHKNVIHNLEILCSKCHENVHKGLV